VVAAVVVLLAVRVAGQPETFRRSA